MLNRRNLLGGMLAIPAIVRSGSLMRISKLPTEKGYWITPGVYMKEFTETFPVYDSLAYNRILDSLFDPEWYVQSGNCRHLYLNVRSSNLAQVLKDHPA